MKLEKGKNFLYPKFPCTADTIELESTRNLHDCIDVASFIGQLLCEAQDEPVMKFMFCVSQATVKAACC